MSVGSSYDEPSCAFINAITGAAPRPQYVPVFLTTVINVPGVIGCVNLICLVVPLTEKSASN